MGEVGALRARLMEVLAQTQSPSPPNQLAVDDLPQVICEHLRFMDEEAQRFPDSAGGPQWDLYMADADHGAEATFILYAVDGDAVEVAVGRGNGPDVIACCDTAPRDPASALRVFEEQFHVSRSRLHTSRTIMEAWEESAKPTRG
jgi:hypothetical protein